MRSITEWLRNILFARGYFISRLTDLVKVRMFLKSIYPFNTEHQLIRVGGDADGAYLLPNDLEGVKFCFSPGVSDIAFFEEDCVSKGIKCFLSDYSVSKPPINHELISFQKKFLGSKNDEIYIRLATWVEQEVGLLDDQLLLQMDIEGDEYSVILDAEEALLLRFRILVIEFHYLEGLFDSRTFPFITQSFEKLLKHFDIVHIDPNNCLPPVKCFDIEIPPVLEITFLRKDRVINRSKATVFPHPLDVINHNNKSFNLPKCWYQS